MFKRAAYVDGNQFADLGLSQDVGKLVFGTFPWILKLCAKKKAREQYNVHLGLLK